MDESSAMCRLKILRDILARLQREKAFIESEIDSTQDDIWQLEADVEAEATPLDPDDE